MRVTQRAPAITGAPLYDSDDAAAAPARRRRRLPGARLWLGLGIILGILLLWQLVVLAAWVPPYILPAPGAVAAKAVALAQTGALQRHVGTTLVEALLGFAIALVIGTAVGYVIGKSKLLAGAVAPYIAALQAIPIVALAPLLVAWFGLGLAPKMIIATLIVFFPILVNTVVGLQSIDPELTDAAQTLGAGRWSMLWYVEAPLAARAYLGGVKMGLALAMTGAMVAEFVAADSGLGFMMTLARSNYDAPMLYVAALTMALVAFLGYALVTLLEWTFIDW